MDNITLDKKTALRAAYYLICTFDSLVPSDELKIWLGAINFNRSDDASMDPAIMEYWDEAIELAIQERDTIRKPHE